MPRMFFERLSDSTAHSVFLQLLQIASREYEAAEHRRDHVHVATDIDDTIVHSGIGLGGPKFPKATIMPGKSLCVRESVGVRDEEEEEEEEDDEGEEEEEEEEMPG